MFELGLTILIYIVFVVYWRRRQMAHEKRLQHYKVRVHVNGIRGKSTVTRLIAGVLTEGRIDTFPLSGSTLLEPWRRDSTRGYEKWHATLQAIRRRATVRVIPTEGGYLLDVIVLGPHFVDFLFAAIFCRVRH